MEFSWFYEILIVRKLPTDRGVRVPQKKEEFLPGIVSSKKGGRVEQKIEVIANSITFTGQGISKLTPPPPRDKKKEEIKRKIGTWLS